MPRVDDSLIEADVEFLCGHKKRMKISLMNYEMVLRYNKGVSCSECREAERRLTAPSPGEEG